MSFRGEWSGRRDHHRFSGPPVPPPRIIPTDNFQVPQAHNGMHQWPPPAPPPNSHTNEVGFTPNYNANPVRISHGPPPNFQHVPPPGPGPLPNNYSNPSLNIPPPPFTSLPPYRGPTAPPPHNPSYAQRPADGSQYPSNVPIFPSGINFSSPPPPYQGHPKSGVPPPHQNHPSVIPSYAPHPIPFTPNLPEVKTQEQKLSRVDCNTVGAKKLEQWLQTRKKLKKPEWQGKKPDDKRPVQISSFMHSLKEMHEVLNNLSNHIAQMSATVSTTDEAAWELSKLKCDAMKDKLCSEFGSCVEDHLEDVRKKVSKRKSQRARIKRARAAKFEQEHSRQQAWIEKGNGIDKWQERLRAKIREENKEKRKKLVADRTLSKVSREIHDATRLIDTMFALQKLRLIRRDAAQKRGDSEIGESRQQFEEKIKDMTRLVQAQLECYKDEEGKLKQILKSEEEEKSKLERQGEEDKARKQQEAEDNKLRTMLFGTDDVVAPTDPLFPFNQYYRQSEHSLSALLQIRQEWDSFLVSRGTPASSCIPSSWVIPDHPNSALWASALQ